MSDVSGTTRVERSPTDEVVRLLVANHREFLNFLQDKVGNRAVAEDILQEAFVRGIGHLDALESSESAIGWFYRVLRNAVIDYYRRRAASERKLGAFAAELESTVPEGETLEFVCQCVNRLAEALKPEYAAALRRVEVEGASVKDYAREFGISRSNAAARVSRARRALKKQLARSCGTCAEHGCFDCTCAGP